MAQVLAELHFLRPLWLILLVPALLLWLASRREADAGARWRKVMDAPLLAALTVGGDARRRLGPDDLLLAGWAAAILAVAGPTWRQAPSPFAASARPAMFVLKVTPSMQERDLAPSRLDRAREKMADLMKLREGAPTGLVAYAGSAHLALPPTPDAAAVTSLAAALAPEVMPRAGDALADAVKLARKVLAEGGAGGSIVVFADAAPALSAPQETGAPVTLYAMLAPSRAKTEPSLLAAAQALDAALIAPTPDMSDVTALAATLASAGPAPPSAGEAPRWVEAGYALTPLVALIALCWFRRGWALA